METYNNTPFSLIIPVFNESLAIKEVCAGLAQVINQHNLVSEIIIVDDGSDDRTKDVLKDIQGTVLVTHPYNKGYGAAIKTGVRHAKHDWILFFDGDGQHRPGYILELLRFTGEYDMIVGARQGYQGPWIRQPGKKFLRWLAGYLVDYKIPDLNSGFRIVKTNLFNRFVHLYPNTFSLTTTITLAFIKEGLNVKYVPIEISRRTGKSMVRPRHALQTLALIARIIALFSPMRIFLPLSLLCLAGVVGFGFYDLLHFNISDTTVIFLVSSILLFIFGALLDQISAIRRDIR